MPFKLGSRSRSKSLPAFKAPSRKERPKSGMLSEHKIDRRVPRVVLNLVDNVYTSLSKEGNWFTELDIDDDNCHELLHQQQLQEKLLKERASLRGKNAALLDLAKEKTEELESLEKKKKRVQNQISRKSRTYFDYDNE